MGQHKTFLVPCMDGADLFVKVGFSPDVVMVWNMTTMLRLIWSRALANDGAIEMDADGGGTLSTAQGIKLVKIEEAKAIDMSADPSAVENWDEANGIQITADAALLGNDDILLIEAWEAEHKLTRIVHDGGTTQTFVQDASVDLRNAGVSTSWIVYNQSNGDYAYVGEIQKPSGKNTWCRATLVDSNGDALTAAAIADNDVIFFIPQNVMGYPLSDIGAMS